MNENSVITKTRRRKLCMAASDPEKPLAVITHVAFGNGGVNGSGEPLVSPGNTDGPQQRTRSLEVVKQ